MTRSVWFLAATVTLALVGRIAWIALSDAQAADRPKGAVTLMREGGAALTNLFDGQNPHPTLRIQHILSNAASRKQLSCFQKTAVFKSRRMPSTVTACKSL